MENQDRYKKERALLRRAFIKTTKEFETVIQDRHWKKEDITDLINRFEDKAERLYIVDQKLNDIYLSVDTMSEGELEQEWDDTEFYRNEFIRYKNKSYYLLNNNQNHRDEDNRSTISTSESSKRKFRLPKLELKKFSGDVKEWIGFWGQFKKIHQDQDIDNEDKFQYLLQSTEDKSAARELVASFPPSADNYEKAIEQLKNRFARDELLIEVYVRELLNLVLNQKVGISLSSLFDKLETQLRALETLGVTSDKYAAMLYPLVESALPEDILRVWERHRSSNYLSLNNKDQTNYLNMLLEFLRSEVESEERINLAQKTFLKEKMKKSYSQITEIAKSNETEPCTAASLTVGIKDTGKKIKWISNNCIFCNRKHLSKDCISAQKLSFNEKKDLVSKKNCCFGCLKPNHNLKNCKIFLKCILCSKKHVPIMCPDLQMKQELEKGKTEESKVVENTLASHNQVSKETLLQTLSVRVVNEKTSKVVRVLLDTGSQRSYILSNLAAEMNFTKIREENLIQGVFGGTELNPEIRNLFEVTIQSLDRSFSTNIHLLEQKKICNYIPRLTNELVISNLKKKNNIIITDSTYDSLEISILLGADVLASLFTGTVENIEEGIIAMQTKLGWTLMGRLLHNKMNSFQSTTQTLLISDLWNLDVLGITDPVEVKSKNDMHHEVLERFNNSIIFNKNQRYEVMLPWSEGHPELHSNKEISEKRLISVTSKLRDMNKFSEYEQVFHEWEQLKIIEEVTNEFGSNSCHYLPHHAIIKDSSASTKIRPVFNASAKDKRGHSLNSCLETGPNLLELIPSILLGFRIGSIGVISDIKKAFLQISLAEKDRDFLRFLWWKDYSKREMKIYRHCRVVFGVKSSPFLLAATINHHLEAEAEQYKNTALKLKQSFYVDNCVTSVNSDEELNIFISESTSLMTKGSFDLRGWIHSFGEGNEDIACKNNVTSVLGLSWNFKNDTLFCDMHSINDLSDVPSTRRGLLSIAQKLFDPIGFTCPVLLIPKTILQTTWKLKLGWDKELPEEIIKQFKKWVKQISWLNLCVIPRALSYVSLNNSNNTLHIFCDASRMAYAACVFIRMEFEEKVSVQLLQAKSRIAPMKEITLPRLELMAALIGSRLSNSIKQTENLNISKTFYWSDSTVVLAWIKTKGDWNTFVGNRVKEICIFTDSKDWNHVPGEMNIADLPSRGCDAKHLMESKWWEGPDWLKEKPECWPKSNDILYPEYEIEKERKKYTTTVICETKILTKNFNYFSKFTKICRMIGWILRFHFNSKSNEKGRLKNELTFAEIKKAETYLLKMIQTESFGKLKLEVVHNLQVFIDKQDLLRVKTRLSYLDDTEQFKFPILLPTNHEIVNKLIYEQHILNHHAGVITLLGILRENYWILKGRKTIKQVLSNCVICKRHSQKSIETPFAPLPENRIKDTAPFQVTGIDYAGPLYLKEEKKAWFVIFTCAVYRAVHLELVTSLSTDTFLLVLRRFIARRGRVSIIYSDNGTNFIGANNHLKKIDWEEIVNYSSVKKIEWIFNTPTASWWGGWWERMIRTIKELLRRNLGKSNLNYEELTTILCDCESIINSRPLTYVSENEELIPLSPAHFIQSNPSSEVPDLDVIDRQHLMKRYRYLQKIRQDMRTRFRKEYLSNLINYGFRKSSFNLQVGDIVILEVDNVKRVNWPIAKVLEIYPGKDNVSRVARIKLSHHELIRPVQKLYPLEIRDYTILNKEKKTQEENDEEQRLASRRFNQEEGNSLRTRYGRLVRKPSRYGDP